MYAPTVRLISAKFDNIANHSQTMNSVGRCQEEVRGRRCVLRTLLGGLFISEDRILSPTKGVNYK